MGRATAGHALVAQLQAGARVFNKLSLPDLMNVAEVLNHTIICEAGKTYVKVETCRSSDAPQETLDEIEVDMPSSTPDSPGRPESGPQ